MKTFTTGLVALLTIGASGAFAQMSGTFKNQTDTELWVYWVDKDDQNRAYGETRIAPQGTAAFQTHKGNTWRFFSNEKRYFGEYLASDVDGQTHIINTPEAAEVRFENPTPFNVQVYQFDPWLMTFILRAEIQPKFSASITAQEGSFWVTSIDNVRLKNHIVKAGQQTIPIDVPYKVITVKNARPNDISVYSITNTNKSHRMLGERALRPGEEGKYTAWAGAILTFRENNVLIGTARVTNLEKHEFDIMDDEKAAESVAAQVPIAVDFVNQSGQPLVASLLLPSLDEQETDGESEDPIPLYILKANKTKRIEAYPYTTWMVSTQDGDFVGEYDISLLPVQQIVITAAEIPEGR